MALHVQQQKQKKKFHKIADTTCFKDEFMLVRWCKSFYYFRDACSTNSVLYKIIKFSCNVVIFLLSSWLASRSSNLFVDNKAFKSALKSYQVTWIKSANYIHLILNSKVPEILLFTFSYYFSSITCYWFFFKKNLGVLLSF